MRAAVQGMLIRAMVCAGLGVVTTVLVAWALAAWLPHRGMLFRYNLISQPGPIVAGSKPTPRYISVYQFSRPGMVRLSWRPWLAGATPVSLLTHDLRPESTMDLKPTVRQNRSWGNLPGVLASDFAKAGNGGEDARGWPKLSMWCQIDDGSPSGFVSRGGIALSGPGTSVGAARVLPLRPIWRGFVADSLVYSVAWSAGIAAFIRGRRALRNARGCCPGCGYDLRESSGSVCPECGWARRSVTPPS